VPLDHQLAGLITAAATGRFPAVDGGWRRVPLWRPGLEAIIAFTGHAVLAVAPDISDERLASLGVDGFGGAHDPRLVTALAGPGGWIDSLDIVMAGRGTGQAGQPPRLVDRPDLAAHPRAAFAAMIRDQPRAMGYPDPGRLALAVISRGIAGLTELSFELEPGRRGRGGGAGLVRDALSTIPSGQLVLAAVAPGNAASVRALLAAGFVPLASIQLFRRAARLFPQLRAYPGCLGQDGDDGSDRFLGIRPLRGHGDVLAAGRAQAHDAEHTLGVGAADADRERHRRGEVRRRDGQGTGGAGVEVTGEGDRLLIVCGHGEPPRPRQQPS
jgi:hypothetical protein